MYYCSKYILTRPIEDYITILDFTWLLKAVLKISETFKDPNLNYGSLNSFTRKFNVLPQTIHGPPDQAAENVTKPSPLKL